MSLPRYPEYKDSGVPWVPDVPSHWVISPLKRIAELKSGNGITSEEIEEEGDFPVYGGNGVRGYTDRFTHDGEFALIGRQGALCGNINYAKGRFWASEHAVVVTPVERIETRWLGELLRSMNLNQYSVSAAQPGLSVETISNHRIPVPPPDEQRAIATFLDRQTAKIDALIAEQEKLLALLAEKRQATISHAVTRGLNPNAPMKESGIAWLGEVPAHWEVKRLKHVTSQITVGIVVEPSKYYLDEGIPTLRSLNVRDGTISSENLVFISAESNDLLAKSKIFAGDIVVVRSGQTGAAAVVPDTFDGANCIDLIIIRKPRGGCEKYLCWFLASHVAIRQIEGGSEGAIQKHFNIGTAANLVIAWPEPKEQREIATFLGEELAKLAELESLASREIQLLRERRSALISAAVTGKIDTRNHSGEGGVR